MRSDKRKRVEEPLSDKGAGVERTETIRPPISNVLGEVIRTTGIAPDISEREQAEEALSESGNKYRTVFETTGTATILVEEDTTISLVNVEFENNPSIDSRKKEDLNKCLATYMESILGSR